MAQMAAVVRARAAAARAAARVTAEVMAAEAGVLGKLRMYHRRR